LSIPNLAENDSASNFFTVDRQIFLDCARLTERRPTYDKPVSVDLWGGYPLGWIADDDDRRYSSFELADHLLKEMLELRQPENGFDSRDCDGDD
jgi:hypothetical protein